MKIIQDHMASKQEYEQQEKSIPITPVRLFYLTLMCLCVHSTNALCYVLLFCVFKGRC
jgi:hypothetical protein